MTCQQPGWAVLTVAAVVLGEPALGGRAGAATAHPAAGHARLRRGARGGRLRPCGRAGPLQRPRRGRLPRGLRRDLRHAGQGPLLARIVGRPVSAHVRHRPRVAPADVVASARRHGTAVRTRDLLRRPGLPGPSQPPGAADPSTLECPDLRRLRGLERVQSDGVLPGAPAHAAETTDSTRAGGSGALGRPLRRVQRGRL